MTVDEMHYDFMIKSDKVASSQKKNFNSAEIDWFLNEAQEILIKQKLFGNNKFGTSFEESQKRIDDLSTIHVKFPLQLPINSIKRSSLENLDIYELPLNLTQYPYQYFVKAFAYTISDCGEKKANIKLVQNDDLDNILKSSFSLDEENLVGNIGKGYESPSSIYVYTKYPIKDNKIYIEYIRKPLSINLGNYTYLDGNIKPKTNSDLSEHTHREIVDLAVIISSNSLDANSYSIKKDKLIFNE